VVGELGEHPVVPCVSRDADALVLEDESHHVPAPSDVAEHSVVAHPYVVEEDLVEVLLAHHRLDRDHGDPRTVHGHQEDRDSVVLLVLLGRPGGEEAPVRQARIGRPDLLAVEHPFIAVAPRGELQRTEVGARLGLTEPLAPDRRPGRDAGQVPGTLLTRPHLHEDGADPVEAHVLRTAWLEVGPHLLAEHSLLPQIRLRAAVLGRPAQSQQVVVREAATDP
jgi:hypothetical protein